MSRTPTSLLARAALWLVLAVAVDFLTGFLLGFAAGFLTALHHGRGSFARLLTLFITPASAFALQGMLLLGARRYGRPPRGVGLGWEPIRRPALLAVLAFVQILVTFAWGLLVVGAFGAPRTIIGTTLRQAVRNDPWLLGVFAVLAILVAPVCEELFFRGWLWTALHQRWTPVRTAVVTAGPWLLLHAADGGWRRVVMLVPAAAFFSVGRHRCESVRASIVMHVGNNGVVAAVAVLAAAVS